jgi:glycosyltransferase involved in cell wall biosynthesis
VVENVGTLPLVAIVTPVYNGGNYLAKAMRSVQRQTYSNIIHILLNNASTDNTSEIIASFGGGPVKVVSHTNDQLLPLHENWNKAFSYLPENAVYAKLLCADDLMHPDCIQRFVALAEMDSDIQVVLSDDVYCDMVYRANLPSGATIFSGIDVARCILDRSVFWLPYQHFFVRIDKEDRGSNFCGDVPFPDPYVVVRSALRGKFGYLHQPLVYTRCHPESQTSASVRLRDATLLVAHLHLVKLFGGRCWDGLNYRRVLDLNVGRLARFVLRWLLAGKRHAAKLMNEQLAKEGVQLELGDYVRYALGWPAYMFNKRSRRTPIGPHIDEQTFAQIVLSEGEGRSLP